MFDLITIGDAALDTFIKIHDADIRCNLSNQDCQLCVDYGDKIPVDKLTHLIGGNAANGAVGSARLGLKTAIYVNIGDDSPGKQIKEKLKEEGVDNRFVVIGKGKESNYSAVLIFKGERTIFVYHQPWEYRLPDLDKSRWIYLTSLSPTFLSYNIQGDITAHLERNGCKLLYNPGTHQIQAGIKKNPQILALSEIFIVNKEEAKKILGVKESDNPPVTKLLGGLRNLGPKMIIITCGKDGSYGFDGVRFYQLGIFPANCVDTTGAGDAYASGVLAGLFYAQDLKEAMRWGAANAGSVVEHLGAQEGLLTYDKMLEKLKENSKLAAKQI